MEIPEMLLAREEPDQGIALKRLWTTHIPHGIFRREDPRGEK